MWDDHVNLPIPPMDKIYNATAGGWCEWLFGIAALAAMLTALKHWRDTKNPIMPLIMLGGLIASVMEPYVDILGGCFHPIIGQHSAFALMGRPIPWWTVASYAAYFGGLGMLLHHSFTSGITMRKVWLLFCAPLVVNIAIEELMLNSNLYYYYGQQPLLIIKFPAWWGPCNSMGVFIFATLITLFGSQLRGWKMLLIPFIMPVADGMAYAAVGLPSIMAVNTANVPHLVTTLAGIGTYALTALALHAIALLVATDSPLRDKARLAAV